MLNSRFRSASGSRSMRVRSRSTRSAWRRDTTDWPSAVRDNIEARPSRGSGLRSISPSRSSFATAEVSAGCLICSVLTRSLSRHGPSLDRVCSTDSAEKLSRSEAASRRSASARSQVGRRIAQDLCRRQARTRNAAVLWACAGGAASVRRGAGSGWRCRQLSASGRPPPASTASGTGPWSPVLPWRA